MRAGTYRATTLAAAILVSSALLASAGATTTSDCQYLSGGLSDSFEAHYSAPGGLNPNLCAPVNPTVPGDNGSKAGTWVDNTAAEGSPTNCIEQAKPPASGKGIYAVKIHANAGTGGFGQDCIWMSSWRYVSYSGTNVTAPHGADAYYGLMWYFPSSGYNDPSGGQHDSISEFNWHPFIYNGPLGYSLFGDTMQWYMRTGAYCKGCEAQYRNGGEYENPTSTQDNMGPITNWRIVPRGSLVRDKWIETIVHVHYANDSTGAIQAWYRVKGSSTWIGTINQSGFPTIDWGPDSGQNFTWTPYNEEGVTTMDHLGVYRTSDNPAPATTFWIDNFQRQPTFSAVANSMP